MEKEKIEKKDFITYMIQSRAESTSKKIFKEINKFFNWNIRTYGKINIPTPVAAAAIYLYKRHKESQSYATVVNTHAALKWVHSFLPFQFENPLNTPICQNILETAKRQKMPTKKKTPLTTKIIQEIIQKHAKPDANLKDLRIACTCSLGFCGFLRYNELANITTNHIQFETNYVRILIPKPKNDIYREGNYIYIKKSGTTYCSVEVLRRYIDKANTRVEPNLPIFRPLRFYRSSNTFKAYGTRLSYTRCREIFKECIQGLGYDHREYGLHSLRSGGATAIANCEGVSERLLKIHGRWKSDVAKDMYVQESIENRLRVTEKLKL